MNRYFYLIAIAIAIFFASSAHGKGIENRLLGVVMRDIKYITYADSLKKELRGVALLYDPVSDKTLIRYDKELSKKTEDLIKQITDDELRKILSVDVPEQLLNSMYILDTLDFFSKSIYKEGKYCIRVIKCTKPLGKIGNYISLNSVNIVENALVLSFLVSYTKYVYEIEIDLDDNVYSVRKRNIYMVSNKLE